MNNILLFTNDLELGTTLSTRLLHANKKVIFVDQLYDLDDDADMFIIDLDDEEIEPKNILKIFERSPSIRVVGVMNKMRKNIWNDYREAGCEMIYLRSSIIKNIDTILSKKN